MREKFWELPLAELTRAEWEGLCDGCGRCCLHKIEDADTGEVEDTNVACKLLDCGTARCTNYRHRRAFVPDCLRLSLANIGKATWLPEHCAYRRRHENRPIPRWHPLLTGDPQAAVKAGVSAAGRVVSEDRAGPLEHHITDWSSASDKDAA